MNFYFNWDRDELNDKYYDSGVLMRCDGEDCVNIYIRNGEVIWFDLNCEIVLLFVCEKSWGEDIFFLGLLLMVLIVMFM